MDTERDLRAHLLERTGAPIPGDLTARLSSRIDPRRPVPRWAIRRRLILASGSLAAVLVAAVLVANLTMPPPHASSSATATVAPSTPPEPSPSSTLLPHPTGARDEILSLRVVSSGGAPMGASNRLLHEDAVFVLYGDGRTVFGPSGKLLGGRSVPPDYQRYTVVLDPAQVDALLRYALDVGRLRDAYRSYPIRVVPSVDAILSIDADGISMGLFVTGPGADDQSLSPTDRSIRTALGTLISHLEEFPESAVVAAAGGATIYRADAYLAVLDDQLSLLYIDGWPVKRFSPWPLPSIPPSAFHGDRSSGRSAVITAADFDALMALGNRFAGGVAVLGPDDEHYLIRARPLLPGDTRP